MFTLSIGRPLVCSTLTSVAPCTVPSTLAMRCAVSLSTALSSPNTFTATSERTPEISSLKRSWIGCENS